MGVDSSFNGNKNNKNDLYETKGTNNENNKLDVVKEKKDSKSLINNIITNIRLNQEYDETKGLKIEYLDKFIDTIFPDNVPKSYIEIIRNQIHEIKDVEIGMKNNIKNIFEMKNIDNKHYCIFICSIKKVSETKINIAYKFQIINASIKPIETKPIETKPIETKPNEIKEPEEFQALIQNEVKKEFKKLNEII